MTGWNNGRAFACRAGDRWFESRREHFAKKVDYFMIFAIYSRPGPGREGGNVTKEFKLVLESAYNLCKRTLKNGIYSFNWILFEIGSFEFISSVI